MKRIILIVAAALVLSIALTATFVFVHEPAQRELTDLRIEATPERIERGRYLANSVNACLHCHTAHDDTKRSHPRMGPDGAGGACYTPEMEFPGYVCIPNITPDKETGIGAWTDDEILRAMREGVSRDGRALFPIMPYGVYKDLSDEDAYSIVAYLRTLAPVNRPEPHTTKINFPVDFFIELEPAPLEAPVPSPDRTDHAAWGRYLATVAGCRDCHAEGKGGNEYPTSSGVVRTSNITTHATGVLPPTADAFVRLFKSYEGGTLPEGVVESDYTPMPWETYAQMTEEDLRAIHGYFASVEPVDNQVQTYAAAE